MMIPTRCKTILLKWFSFQIAPFCNSLMKVKNMPVKNICKIISTGELCVVEGGDVMWDSNTGGLKKTSHTIHVRIIDPSNYEQTNQTRDVDSSDLVTYLVWDPVQHKYV